MELDKLKEEKEKLSKMSKVEYDKSKKPPRPKANGIVIKDVNNSNLNKPRKRSQSNSVADLKNKGKGKLDEPPSLKIIVKPKLPKVTLHSTTQVLYSHDDISIQKEDVIENTKKRKRIGESEDENEKSDGLTSSNVQVNKVQNIQTSEKPNYEVTTYDDTKKVASYITQAIKSFITSDQAQGNLENLSVVEKRKLL